MAEHPMREIPLCVARLPLKAFLPHEATMWGKRHYSWYRTKRPWTAMLAWSTLRIVKVFIGRYAAIVTLYILFGLFKIARSSISPSTQLTPTSIYVYKTLNTSYMVLAKDVVVWTNLNLHYARMLSHRWDWNVAFCENGSKILLRPVLTSGINLHYTREL